MNKRNEFGHMKKNGSFVKIFFLLLSVFSLSLFFKVYLVGRQSIIKDSQQSSPRVLLVALSAASCQFVASFSRFVLMQQESFFSVEVGTY